MMANINAEWVYNGGIGIWCHCDCCGKVLSDKIDDVDSLFYSSIESYGESMLIKNGWDSFNVLCPECSKDGVE